MSPSFPVKHSYVCLDQLGDQFNHLSLALNTLSASQSITLYALPTSVSSAGVGVRAAIADAAAIMAVAIPKICSLFSKI